MCVVRERGLRLRRIEQITWLWGQPLVNNAEEHTSLSSRMEGGQIEMVLGVDPHMYGWRP